MSDNKPTARKTTPKKIRELVYLKYDRHCAYCGVLLEKRELRVDHKVSLAKGGSNDLDNLMPACHDCNRYKLFYDLEIFRMMLGKMIKGYPKHLRERLAVKYGYSHIRPEWDGEFYFEKVDRLRAHEEADSLTKDVS